MRARLALVVAAVLLAVGTATFGSQSIGLSPGDLAEYPIFDYGARNTLATALSRKDLRRRLAETPDDPDLPRLLADREGLREEALRALRTITGQHPELIARAFDRLPAYQFALDGAKPLVQELREIVALAKTKLAALPREDAARAAYALLRVEAQAGPRDNQAEQARLQAFLAEYAGTEAALRAENRDSCAPQRALYSKAASLARNPGRPDDPVTRFRQVLDLVHQLETNEAQRCEGLDRLSDAVIQFSVREASRSSPATIDQLLQGYEGFARAHFVLDAANPSENGMGYLITHKMADLYGLRGDRVAGVETFLDELRRENANPEDIKTLQAAFYIRLMTGAPAGEAIDRALMREKAIGLLRAFHAERSEPSSRRALATLASLYFYERDYAAARTAYQQYLKQYPSSPWAWLATFRLGECQLELDDLPGAAASFERVAAVEGSAALLARLFGGVNAGNTLAALGRVDEAVRNFRIAVAVSDADVGPWPHVRANQAPGPGDEVFRRAESTAETTIYRSSLPRRLAALEESARSRGGASFERGRWLLHRARFDDARAAFARAATESRGTPLEARARSWQHRAQVERALDLATVEGPKRDEPAAIRELEAVDREPLDFNVTAARIALATMAFNAGRTADADAIITTALEAWRKGQPRAGRPAPGLEADVEAIRTVVYLPLGGGVYGLTAGRWNAFEWPARLPSFLVVNPDLNVRLATGEVTRVTLRQPIPRLDNVLFVDEDGLAVLARIMTTLGGTRRREPGSPMETPNQPIGRSLNVAAFWDRFFPTRPGHWSGWEFETYPQISEIAFTDAGRTKAIARVTIGYSGATVVLTKENGVWKAVELTNFWIT
jgi:TolA-binding protein